MNNNVQEQLSKAATSLGFLWVSIYSVWKHFNIEQLSNLRESIVEYKQRILLVVFVHMLIILWKTLKLKKLKFLKIFLNLRNFIVVIVMFIYPFLSDFQFRFGKISQNNVTDFYAIFMPIFIMFFIGSIRQSWDPKFLKEMKEDLSIKWHTSKKVNSLIIRYSNSIMLLAYSFLFCIFIWRICRTDHVNPDYENTFPAFPVALFAFSLGITSLLDIVLSSKSDSKSSTKSDSINTNKLKNNNKKHYQKNIKVDFK